MTKEIGEWLLMNLRGNIEAAHKSALASAASAGGGEASYHLGIEAGLTEAIGLVRLAMSTDGMDRRAST